jgi:hypothetical protein
MAIKSILLKHIDKLAKPIPLVSNRQPQHQCHDSGIPVLQYHNRRTLLCCRLTSSGQLHQRMVGSNGPVPQRPVFGYGALINCAVDEKIEFIECPVYSVIPSKSAGSELCNFFSHYDPKADPELLNMILSPTEMIVSGKLISEVDGPTLLETGITCAFCPRRDELAFYKKSTKEASSLEQWSITLH